MAFPDDFPAEEQDAIDLASQLRDSRNLHPLIARLSDGEVGRERAREVLRLLGEFDIDLLVQITLDGLLSAYREDPGLAYQPRGAVRSEDGAAD